MTGMPGTTGAAGQLDLPLQDVRLSALTWGPHDGPLALLLHGFPDTAWTWRHLGPELGAAGYRVVAPFNRGYAPSGLAPDDRYGVGALVRDTVAIHRHLRADSRAVLVGHDWGALAAYGSTALAPGLFGRTVTLAVPPAPAISRSLTAGRLARQLVASRYMGIALVPGWGERRHAATVADLWQRWSPGYDATSDLGHLAAALPDATHWTAALRCYRGTLAPWAAWRRPYAREHRAALQAAPEGNLLFLYGDRDGCLRPELLAAAAGAVPAAQLVPDTGHFLHLEAPELVNAAIRQHVGPAR